MDRDAQLVLSLPTDPGATFATFATPPNEAVVDHLHRLATGDGAQTAQVVLWGPPGSGKTHLLQAFCQAAAQQGARVGLLPLGELAPMGPDLLEGLETLDAVCLDGLDTVAGDPAWELGLFTLINAARRHGARLVVSTAQAPRGLALHLPDLASRLLWGSVFRLEPLDDTARGRALRLHAAARGFRLPDEVLGYLMRRGPRDMHRLMEVLAALERRSLVRRRRITVPLAREVLAGASSGGKPG